MTFVATKDSQTRRRNLAAAERRQDVLIKRVGRRSDRVETYFSKQERPGEFELVR
jgi:hypothetical protein